MDVFSASSSARLRRAEWRKGQPCSKLQGTIKMTVSHIRAKKMKTYSIMLQSLYLKKISPGSRKAIDDLKAQSQGLRKIS